MLRVLQFEGAFTLGTDRFQFNGQPAFCLAIEFLDTLMVFQALATTDSLQFTTIVMTLAALLLIMFVQQQQHLQAMIWQLQRARQRRALIPFMFLLVHYWEELEDQAEIDSSPKSHRDSEFRYEECPHFT